MMRSVLRGRGTSAIATGVAVLLAAGGGFAIAKSAGSNTVKGCVQKGTHVLYVAKRCHKHDKRLSWNKAGPTGPRGLTGRQGPGASKLVYDATGSVAAPTTPLGNMGPWAVTASCSQPSAGTTTTNLFITGPSGKLDALLVSGASTANGSAAFPAQNKTPLVTGVTSNSATQVTLSAHALWLPSTGTSVETLVTAAATGGTTNTCHASIAITPVA